MRVNIPPTLAAYRHHLRDFFDMMVLKLHQNSHKNTPSTADIPRIVDLMRGEIREFEEQFAEDVNNPNSLLELCDSSNFAFLAFVALREQGVADLREAWIRENLRVCPDTGRVFCAKNRAGSCYRVGDEIAGTTNKDGYVHIRVQGKAGGTRVSCSMPRSHLVWWWQTGKWPINIIDHENRVRNDDRFSNLRDISMSDNNLNSGGTRKLPPFVTCYKPKGRQHLAHYGKYVYQRSYKGVTRRYAYYDTPEEASREGQVRFIEETSVV